MLRRVLTEQRRFLLLLAIVLAANLVVYAALVYPLGARVADASRRSAAAEAAQRTAQRELAAAEAVAAGQKQAESELKTFYQDVLPADTGAASRATYLTVAQLARKCNLEVTRHQAAPEHLRQSALDHLKIDVTLQGTYEDIRRFVYELETTPAFVVIDDVAIAQGRDQARPLVLSLGLSTYYRSADHAS